MKKNQYKYFVLKPFGLCKYVSRILAILKVSFLSLAFLNKLSQSNKSQYLYSLKWLFFFC